MSTDTVELAFKYGPFFFGILLVTTAVRLVKKGGGPSKGLTWLFSVFGLLFMAVSAGWWLKRPGIHVFEGTVRNLRAYERLSSDDLTFFYREEPKTKMGDDDEQLRNVRFAVVKEGDFSNNDSFAIDYRKDGGAREAFSIQYSAGKPPVFVIEWDAATQKNVLKPSASIALGSPFNVFERIAFAEEASASPPVDRLRDWFPPPAPSPSEVAPPAKRPLLGHKPAPAPPRSRPTLNTEAAELVFLLQDSHTEVGAKIGALNRLLTYDSAGLGVLMQASTKAGPVPGTLLDLSRHSDPELASKAQVLLNRGGDLTSIVAKDLASQDLATQANARAVLKSMDTAQAEKVLKPLPAAERETLAPPALGQPIPTGSRRGDRYYVRATWDPQKKPDVACLTSFYNGILVSNRSLADEQKLMQGRSSRLVYGYSRDQALEAANKIYGCGGNPSFVAPAAGE
jgi:hypothetical protein